jgi:uroporphyrin-III C-methyltransferase/precorrin-2 dehydrogenase/sirohydrochlorin ferrochelatase
VDRLPVFIKLDGKRCLVIGGGDVAERKIRLLRRTGAAIGIVAANLCDTLQRQCERGEIDHIATNYRSELLPGHWLVIAATDDTALNGRVARDANDAGLLCNVVDDNATSSFIFPAIVDRSPVLVAIGTEGTAPVLAQQLKGRLEAWLPSRIGELATQAGRWRYLVKKRFPTLDQRQRFWQAFFDGPVARLLLAGRKDEAVDAMRRQLVGDNGLDDLPAGEAWLVGAGPGDPGLVTLRGQQLLTRADVVLYDQLVSREVLDFARKEADLIPVGKRAGHAIMPQQQINELLVSLVRAGKRVCRLKGGDPFVFGRGGEEALALAEAGLPFQVVPGISAALGCAAYAGVPLTLRHTSASVTLCSAQLDKDLSPDWPLLLNAGHTLAVYMGVRALDDIAKALDAGNVAANMPIAIVENGTLPAQRVTITRADTLHRDAEAADICSPAIIFIGRAVASARRLQWFNGGPDSHAPPIARDDEIPLNAALS